MKIEINQQPGVQRIIESVVPPDHHVFKLPRSRSLQIFTEWYLDTSFNPNTSSSMISDRTMIRTRIKFVFPIVSWLTARLDTTLVLYQDGAHSTYVLLRQKQNMQSNV